MWICMKCIYKIYLRHKWKVKNLQRKKVRMKSIGMNGKVFESQNITGK